MRGLIVRSQSGFYLVQTDNGALTCQLRGRHKRGPRMGDLVAIGDRVEVSRLDETRGMIEEILPRQRALVRLAPTPQGLYQQIIIANPDQAVFVFACAQPTPHLGMLDRFLVIAEKQGIPPVIVANKVDLTGCAEAQAFFGHYVALGYPLIYTSAIQSIGLDQLHEQLAGKVSVFTGPSGVGKSSLLNVLFPGLNLIAARISLATEKGRHTTVVREMYPLPGGGFVADTPGIKALALWDIEPEEIDAYFPELRSLVKECQFNDCTHIHEPGCAIRSAVAQGLIHPERYHSYVRMRSGEAENETI